MPWTASRGWVRSPIAPSGPPTVDLGGGRRLIDRFFAVIGGGVVGLSLARQLAIRGGQVMLIEARQIGGGASGASAGMLPAPRGGRSLLSRLVRGAHAGYEAFVRELAAESGAEIEFRRSGLVDLALTATEEDELRRSLAGFIDSGARAEWWGPEELAAAAPGLAAGVRGGIHFPETAWVHPPSLLRALRLSAERRGVEVVEGQGAALTRSSAGKGWEVLVGGPSGRRITGREVIVAAGAWTGAVLASAGIAPAAPIIPIRGQMAELSHPAPPGLILEHAGTYLIARPGGAVWVGATVEDVGFDERVEPEGIEGLIARARRILPGLGPVRRSWAGLRPKLLRRGGPLLGEGDPPVVAGHYRSGIQLGPISAHLVAARIAGDPAPVLSPFNLEPPAGG